MSLDIRPVSIISCSLVGITTTCILFGCIIHTESIDNIMKEHGWYKVKHTLPIEKKHEYRYHNNGSEITEEEILQLLYSIKYNFKGD